MTQTFLFLGGSVTESGVPIGRRGGVVPGGVRVWLLGQPVVSLQINIRKSQIYLHEVLDSYCWINSSWCLAQLTPARLA